MYFIRTAVHPSQTTTVNIRCPACRHSGAFHGLEKLNDAAWTDLGNSTRHEGTVHAGLRICPNTKCNVLIFVIIDYNNKLVTSYPPEIIDFDSTDLPEALLRSLEEGIKAHAAGCYRASALMIRRVLEELCDDKKITGSNLKDRIAGLGKNAIVPADLLSAADELRILGNDAAHIRSIDYDSIGEQESAIAIELAKELLKAVYQYSSLVNRLRALKRPDAV